MIILFFISYRNPDFHNTCTSIHRFRIMENPSRFFRIPKPTCHYEIPSFHGCSISGDPWFPGSSVRERHRIKHFGIGTFFPQIECSWVNGSRNVRTFPKATMEWKNGLVNRAKGKEGEKEKGRGKNVCLFSPDKKKKKFLRRSNCRFKQRGNLEPEDRSNLESIFQRRSPFFSILFLSSFFFSSSYICPAIH